MAHTHSWRTTVAKPAGVRPLHWTLVLGYVLVVAGGAKGVSLFGSGMMMGVALVGAWLMFTLGMAYAAVRLRPAVGGALLLGFGIGALLVVVLAGMQLAL
ncbi:hypothetical protein VA596_15175 [Amycolatopsis sp., V23-08]|uniref:DUF4175 domain-containing protein n=1 Tax=Amycolatopsis heterodermiae TaxID=3110235 RepID=A0ABU5R3Z8_9PSEU|nr:hypothetical protein [Amycolatopsis sp., V23-08]MEA5360888.1 hypothetical protein [Amycolatopsis sp., V23-08]